MRERIADICPEIEVGELMKCLCFRINLEELILKRPDYVIDAIDTVTAKIAIAELTKKHGIPLIRSMGTGINRIPNCLRSTDLPKTSVCPLCKGDAEGTERKRNPASKKCCIPKKRRLIHRGRETGRTKASQSAAGSISFYTAGGRTSDRGRSDPGACQGCPD